MGTNPSDEFPLLFLYPSLQNPPAHLKESKFAKCVRVNPPSGGWPRSGQGAIQIVYFVVKDDFFNSLNLRVIFITHISIFNIFEFNKIIVYEFLRIDRFYN